MSDGNHPFREPGQPGPASQGSFSGTPIRPGTHRPPLSSRLRQIADDLQAGHIETAEKKLSEYLDTFPEDADAIMLMARAMDRSGRTSEAVSLLSRCLKLDPEFASARFVRGRLLFRLHRYREALAEIETLLTREERNPRYREVKADILSKIGEEKQASEICRALAAENPRRAESWVLYGATLRSMGANDEAVAAYRRATEARPSCGWAWWSLADIKGVHFSNADICAMQEQLAQADLSADDRTQMLFALGMAYERVNDYQHAFEHYARANAASRHAMNRSEHSSASRVARFKALFTPGFLRSRTGAGCQAPDPIFVLGRPRSGSTLIEQILASHSEIEGVGELPYVVDLIAQLAGREALSSAARYPEALERLDHAALAALGSLYLESAALHRKSGQPYFVDKMPGNFLHVGMIHLILPNAKIIDIRRNPAATCLSMFKHNFGKSNPSLEELGRLYREYVEIMAHYDRVLPGRVVRIVYEELVASPEAEIRKLLQRLDLPFEESCLNYHATERAIRTPSAEQVRRPMYGDAVDHWRLFEPWLGPLTTSLGSVLAEYPAVPAGLC
jgi:tetratricopeptide (TPR) repeat protein